MSVSFSDIGAIEGDNIGAVCFNCLDIRTQREICLIILVVTNAFLNSYLLESLAYLDKLVL